MLEHPSVESKHLVRRTTFRDFHHPRIGRLEALTPDVRDKLLEEERLIRQRQDQGAELWEWDMRSTDHGRFAGLAFVRDGEILVARACYHYPPRKVNAGAVGKTALRFYEKGTPAPPGQLQRTIVTSLIRTPGRREGVPKTLLLDPEAETADSDKPAFLAPPPDSEPFHGSPLLDVTRTDGWCLGAVTDPCEPDCARGCTIGELFVETPDGRRAALCWNVEMPQKLVELAVEDPRLWGSYHVTFMSALRDLEGLKEMFLCLLPILKQMYARAMAKTKNRGQK